jgi:hypothetical protein
MQAGFEKEVARIWVRWSCGFFADIVGIGLIGVWIGCHDVLRACLTTSAL